MPLDIVRVRLILTHVSRVLLSQLLRPLAVALKLRRALITRETSIDRHRGAQYENAGWEMQERSYDTMR